MTDSSRPVAVFRGKRADSREQRSVCCNERSASRDLRSIPRDPRGACSRGCGAFRGVAAPHWYATRTLVM
jgi:hypothetical protein